MKVPFWKVQGAGNDFLFTWAGDAPPSDYQEFSRQICARHTGVGADGWYLLRRPNDAAGDGFDVAIELYNSDGSKAELSGNGTRCAAALLVHEGLATSPVTILTGAGRRELRLLGQQGAEYYFEMQMGRPVLRDDQLRLALPLTAGPIEVTALDVGNPQCAVFVDDFPDNWALTAAEIEGHRHFPNRTNVSFVRVLDSHTIEARFYERGAGETLSSGTGSMGAAAAAIRRGKVQSPVRVITAAGPLDFRWDDDAYLTGPASVIASGLYFYD